MQDLARLFSLILPEVRVKAGAVEMATKIRNHSTPMAQSWNGYGIRKPENNDLMIFCCGSIVRLIYCRYNEVFQNITKLAAQFTFIQSMYLYKV